jgi:hypothetical protein
VRQRRPRSVRRHPEREDEADLVECEVCTWAAALTREGAAELAANDQAADGHAARAVTQPGPGTSSASLAVCDSCEWQGPTRETRDEADRDALAHSRGAEVGT